MPCSAEQNKAAYTARRLSSLYTQETTAWSTASTTSVEQDAGRNERRLDAHLHRLQQEKAHQGRSKEEGKLTAEERAILIAEIQAVSDCYTY